MITISLIIPVYNSAGIITQTIESVFSQRGDYSFEVIIIDDGSKDDTLRVCQGLAAKYDNLIVLHQKNSGPSAARNHGLKYANGKYIVFVDADDLPEKEMLKVLLGLMDEDTELGIASYCIDFIDEKNKSTEMVLTENDKYFVKDSDFGAVCCEWYGNHILTPLWNKIYRKDIIDKHGLRFDERVSISEDLLWNINYIKKIDKVTTADECVYHYIIRKRRETVTHGFNKLHVEMQMKVAVEMIDFLQHIRYGGKEIYYLSLKYITSSLCNVFGAKDWSKKEKKIFISKVMNEPIVEELAEKADAEGWFAKTLVYIYKKRDFKKLQLILKMLYIFRNYFHVLQRKLMKVLRN